MHWDHEPPLHPPFRLRQGYGGQVGHPLPLGGGEARGEGTSRRFRFAVAHSQLLGETSRDVCARRGRLVARRRRRIAVGGATDTASLLLRRAVAGPPECPSVESAPDGLRWFAALRRLDLVGRH